MGLTGDLNLNLMASCQLGFIMDKHVKNKVGSIPSFEGVLHRISIKLYEMVYGLGLYCRVHLCLHTTQALLSIGMFDSGSVPDSFNASHL